MSRGVNKVFILGNLGNDPDTRFTAAGSAITNLSIATDESYKDKQTGQMVPKTEWHRVALFNRLAEIANEYLKKGAKVYIEGKLQTRKWTDKEGVERYSTEIIGHELQMLGSRSGAVPDYPEADNQAPAEYPQHNVRPSPMADNPRGAVHPEYGTPSPDDFDDDIPF